MKKQDLDKAEAELKKADDAAVQDNEYNKFIRDRQKEGKPLPAGETLKKDAEALKKETSGQKTEVKPEPAKPEPAPVKQEAASAAEPAPSSSGSLLGDLNQGK